jgi:predicted transcriptional regulator
MTVTPQQLADLDALLARAREAGIHGNLLRVCLTLHKAQAPLPLAVLVYACAKDHAVMGKWIDRLVALGFAERATSGHDARRKVVELTAGGRAACVRVFGELLESQ